MSSFETLTALQAAIEAHAKQPELLETIANLDAQIKSANATLTIRDSQIIGLNDQIATLKSEMEALKSQLEAAEFRELERTEERDQALDRLNQIFGIAKLPEPPVPLEPASSSEAQSESVAETSVTSAASSADPIPFDSGPVPSMLSPVAPQPAEPAAKPYVNTSFYSVPGDVRYNEWLDKGGREYMASNDGDYGYRKS